MPKEEIKLFATNQDACDKKAHWFHLPVTPRKIVLSYPSLVAQLILKGRKRSLELSGKEVTNVVIPFNEDQPSASLLQSSNNWQVVLIDFRGQILFHLPSSPCSSSKFKNVSLAVEDTCETFLTLCSSFPPLYPMGEGRAVSNRSCLEKGFLSFLVLNRQYN